MQKLIIKGKKKFQEKFQFLDLKMQLLPILAASILANEVKLKNVPLVKDIFTMIELLNFIGLKTKLKKKKRIIEIKNKKKY